MDETDEYENRANLTPKVIPELAVRALGPAADEVGRGLTVVAKAVNVVLKPLAGIVWGFEKTQEFIEKKLAQKLEGVPIKNIQTPPAYIAVPTLEALRYTGSIEELRELFANLLATSMNSEESSKAHPAFVEIIRQLSIDEVRLISLFTSCRHYPVLIEASYDENDLHSSYEKLYPKFNQLCLDAGVSQINYARTYLDNLQRLKLVEIRQSGYDELIDTKDRLYEVTPIYALKESRYEVLYVTDLGRQLISACI